MAMTPKEVRVDVIRSSARARYVPFGESEVDALAKKYFDKVGIDIRLVTGYTITRQVNDVGRINVEMILEDVPADPEVTGLDESVKTRVRPDGSLYKEEASNG